MWRDRNVVLYKYYAPERVDVLERRMIYFSHPSVFNDPFECEPYVEAASVQDSLIEMPPAGNGTILLQSKYEADQHRGELEDRKRNVVIFSLSEEIESILMWAHYAAGHSGFAVGFDSASDILTKRADGRSRGLEQVNYSYLRPRAQTPREVGDREFFLTKSDHWRHEKEWRMFEGVFNADENEPVCDGVWGFWFDPQAVERVVLGSRISQATEARISKVLSEPAYAHVKLLRMEIDARNFRLSPRAIER